MDVAKAVGRLMATAVANGFVSITPIQMDATNYEVLHALQGQISA